MDQKTVDKKKKKNYNKLINKISTPMKIGKLEHQRSVDLSSEERQKTFFVINA